MFWKDAAKLLCNFVEIMQLWIFIESMVFSCKFVGFPKNTVSRGLFLWLIISDELCFLRRGLPLTNWRFLSKIKIKSPVKFTYLLWKSSNYFNKLFRIFVVVNCSLSIFRGGSRAAATTKVECFVVTVNGWKPLTIITKRSILDVAEALDPPLVLALYRFIRR